MTGMREWWRQGTPWIWMNAGAVSVAVCMVLGVMLLIAYNGLRHFWPADLVRFEYQEPGQGKQVILGEIHDQETLPGKRAGVLDWELDAVTGTVTRYLIKIGNREWNGLEFTRLTETAVRNRAHPPDAIVVDRRHDGNVYGWFVGLQRQETGAVDEDPLDWEEFRRVLSQVDDLHGQIKHIENRGIAAVNHGLEQLRLRKRKLEMGKELSQEREQRLRQEERSLQERHEQHQGEIRALREQMPNSRLVLRAADGTEMRLPFEELLRVYRPNSMSLAAKAQLYLLKVWEFLSDEPREANTAGGVFPAIFGTVSMVLLMSLLVTPFGVLAAIYLREYARQGLLTRLIRISVNNLAGVPSIVYGVFGLGFFVYALGGSIDELFYPESLPSPVFGSGGLMWASLTLALLTVPVVIVSTEEGLARIPSSLREGSYALGATKAETLWRTILPMASPAVMTGVILAIARAAGEVAPLMLVGVVKMAPALPVDTIAPFLHMERKFMHLGFHIYDVGFQSPNVEAVRPLVYATALLLVALIVALNMAAIMIRNRLREKYKKFY